MLKWIKFSIAVIVIGWLLLFFVGVQCQQVRILMYHSVKPDAGQEEKLAVSTHAFRQQMELLDSYHYTVIPLEALALLIRDKKPIPAKTIAITFDDTNKDIYLYAFPVLKAYDFAATIFVVTEYTGRPYKLTWDEILLMQQSKLISVGSHTITHNSLKNATSQEALKREIVGSKAIIEKKTRRPVTLFSYPFGECNSGLKNMVKDAGYTAAVVSRPWSNCSMDAYALRRLGVSEKNRALFEAWLAMREFYFNVVEFFKTMQLKLKNLPTGKKIFSIRRIIYNAG